MNAEQTKSKILSTVTVNQELITKEIAKKVGISPSTAAKYLQVLKAEKKVIDRRQPPYTFWSLNKKGGS